MFIDGKAIQKNIELILRKVAQEKTYVLDIIYVGDNPVIETYIRAKKRFGEMLGITVRVHHLPQETTYEQIEERLRIIEIDSSGVIVQLPLPQSLDTSQIINSIDPRLDVDILSTSAYENFLAKKNKRYPPVLQAVLYAIDAYNIELSGKNIYVLGNGRLVGRPIADYLTINNLPFTQMTKINFSVSRLKEADIIFSGMGMAHMITPDMVKDGVVILDCGTSEEGNTVQGDVHPAVSEKASYFTPVPGGIGPLTVTALFNNVLTPYEL